jgi:hypothetical protein
MLNNHRIKQIELKLDRKIKIEAALISFIFVKIKETLKILLSVLAVLIDIDKTKVHNKYKYKNRIRS